MSVTLAGKDVQVASWDSSLGLKVSVRGRAGAGAVVNALSADEFVLSLELRLFATLTDTAQELAEDLISALQTAQKAGNPVELSGFSTVLDGYYYVRTARIGQPEEAFSYAVVSVELVRSEA